MERERDVASQAAVSAPLNLSSSFVPGCLRDSRISSTLTSSHIATCLFIFLKLKVVLTDFSAFINNICPDLI